MAKSDAFFLRAKILQTGSSYVSQEIDLGAFVNLGVSKSTLLRIHAVEVQIADDNEPFKGPFNNGTTMNIGWDLTTQEHTALVSLADKSVVCSGRYMISDQTVIDFDSATKDMMPQSWRNGYLIGVDSLWLNTEADTASTNGDYNVAVCLECTLETATQAGATGLALSQQ